MSKIFSKEFYEDLKNKGLRYCPNCETVKDEKMFRESFCFECSKAVGRNRFVYKFVDDNNQIIYIGKTIRLQARMVEHFQADSHLTDECYDNVKNVFYCSLKTKAEMDIYEIYLIDKYRPQYNIKSVYEQEGISSIVLPNLIWKEYHNESLDLKEKRTISDKKTAAVIEDIRAMVNTLGGCLIDIRDRALILIGFAGAFRRSELVSIEMDDIEFNRDGLTITLKQSKTDQEGQGYKKGIPYGSNPDTCPVRALQDWLRLSNITQGAIFRKIYKNGQNCRQIHNEGLVDKSVALIIKKLAKAAGLDERKYSGDSLRFGSITTAANMGVNVGL